MLFLNSCYLYGMPNDLGLGLQYSNLLQKSSGSVRDKVTGVVTASRNCFDPIDMKVLASVLKDYSQNSWVALDTEGMESRYQVGENLTLEQNVAGFTAWAAAVRAIKTLRPDLKVAANCMWWHPDGANYNKNWVNYSMLNSCSTLYREILHPVIDGLMFELYYTNWSSGPAPTPNSDQFNKVGSSDYPKHGFLQHLDAQHNYLRGICPDKPIFHLLAITHDSRSVDGEAVLTFDEMMWALQLSINYQPFGIMFWGVAPKQNTHRFSDGWEVGTWDKNASWYQALSSLVNQNR